MQDLEGKIIQTTEGTKYVLTEIAGEGAQGVVYNEASDKFLIKLYNRSNPIQNKNRFDKLKWLIQQDYPDQFIRPLALIEAADETPSAITIYHESPSFSKTTLSWLSCPTNV